MSLTPKQARFVEEYLIDLNATAAAKRAGYSKKTARQQAARLLSNVNVECAVAEGHARHRERCEVTRDSMAAQFDEDREFARENSQPGAAVSASTGMAKLFGLLTDKHEHGGDPDRPLTLQVITGVPERA